MRAVIAKGGVVGLCGLPNTVRKSQATVSDLVDHAEYLVSTFGMEACGLGLDYSDGYIDSKVQPPESIRWRTLRPDVFGTNHDFFNLKYRKGVETITGLSNITAMLLDRGYSHDQISAVLGGNWMRAIRDVLD